MSKQTSLDLSSKFQAPVECLGQSFSSDEARQEHYLKLLAEKLKDPEFRKIEGFPIGEDEDILALSDPPYYTACPNPWIGDFIKHYGRPYDPKEKYHREPFAADVSEGKYHPIYKLHPYHTKVPHRAIMRYILNYTQPGEVVFDGFCGTGMTGVAANLCSNKKEVQELGYRVGDQGVVFDQEGKSISKVGPRLSVQTDLAPAATFIASNYNSYKCSQSFDTEARSILSKVRNECDWMFNTQEQGLIDFAVWSDVFHCPQCSKELVFWHEAVDLKGGKVKDRFNCSGCKAQLEKSQLERSWSSHFDEAAGKLVKQTVQKLVLISYTKNGKRFQKQPDAKDLELIERIDLHSCSDWFPTDELPDGEKTNEAKRLGFTHVHHLYTKRNLIALAAFRRYVHGTPLESLLTTVAFRITKRYGLTYQAGRWGAGGGPQNGTYYIPSLVKEINILNMIEDAIGRDKGRGFLKSSTSVISTRSATTIDLPDSSIDYAFIDPPFGSNLMYWELNYIWESWLKIKTRASCDAIESKTLARDLAGYQQMMLRAFSEVYRILKPGRWVTVEFSNTKASVWNTLQNALQLSGFVIGSVAALDKQKGSFNAQTNPTSVKQDLVISAYKPDHILEERVSLAAGKIEGVWDFMHSHLRNLPVIKMRGGELEFIAERDPRILYDRMVAFYVGHGVPVPLSSAEFQAALIEKFPEREGMFFRPEQVAEWDKKRAKVQGLGQMSIFVEDEKSAVDWLRNFLRARPSIYSDIQPDFFQAKTEVSWKKWEKECDLDFLLKSYFLQYDGKAEVPSQIHSYLSTQFKDLRNLAKDDSHLQSRAKDRWYVPDPGKAVDMEAVRDKRLLGEFWELCAQAGINRPASEQSEQRRLPFPAAAPAKKGARKKLKEVRTEAVRLGFKECFAAKNYATILALSEHLPENVIEEDEQLQMIHDMAEMRAEG